MPQSPWKGLEGRVALAHSGLTLSEKALWPAPAGRAEVYAWSTWAPGAPIWPAVDNCLPCTWHRWPLGWTGTAHLRGGSAGRSVGLLTGPRERCPAVPSGAQQCDGEGLGSQAPDEGGGQDPVPTKGLGTVTSHLALGQGRGLGCLRGPRSVRPSVGFGSRPGDVGFSEGNADAGPPCLPRASPQVTRISTSAARPARGLVAAGPAGRTEDEALP